MLKTNRSKTLLVLMVTILGLTGINFTVNAQSVFVKVGSVESAALKYVNMVEPLRSADVYKNNTGIARLLGANTRKVNPCIRAVTGDIDVVMWCVINGLGMPDFQPVGMEQFKSSSTVKNTFLYPPTKRNNYDSYAKVFVKTIVRNGAGIVIRNINRVLTLEKIGGDWMVIGQVFK